VVRGTARPGPRFLLRLTGESALTWAVIDAKLVGTEMDRREPIPDFTEVTLKHAVDVRGVHVPAGAHGVVMAAYADGLAYAVEFEKPKRMVLTLEGRDIQA
jgi:hypothetical protein